MRTESSGNPYAIGVVAGHLVRQPVSAAEAVATARWLQGAGHNFSMGLTQVNHGQAARYGQTIESMFEPCRNLQVGAAILDACHARALTLLHEATAALRAALSCYYSGNFSGGLRAEGGRPSYVDRVLARLETTTPPVAPAVTHPVAPIGLIGDVPHRAMPRPVGARVSRPTAVAPAGRWVWLPDARPEPGAAVAVRPSVPPSLPVSVAASVAASVATDGPSAAALRTDFVQVLPDAAEQGWSEEKDDVPQHGPGVRR